MYYIQQQQQEQHMNQLHNKGLSKTEAYIFGNGWWQKQSRHMFLE